MPSTCAICLDNTEAEVWTVLSPCIHAFHTRCVNEWSLRQPNTLCPLCRTPVDQSVFFSTLNALSQSTDSDDDDDGVFLPRYEDGLLSDDSSDDSSADSAWSSGYSDSDNRSDEDSEYDD